MRRCLRFCGCKCGMPWTQRGFRPPRLPLTISARERMRFRDFPASQARQSREPRAELFRVGGGLAQLADQRVEHQERHLPARVLGPRLGNLASKLPQISYFRSVPQCIHDGSSCRKIEISVRFVSAFAAEGLKHSGRVHELLLHRYPIYEVPCSDRCWRNLIASSPSTKSVVGFASPKAPCGARPATANFSPTSRAAERRRQLGAPRPACAACWGPHDDVARTRDPTFFLRA
jgi:hypothetical protein